MCKLVRTIVGALALCVSSICLQAQDYSELDYYQSSAGEMALIFRGRQVMRYQFPFNGHCYWSTPEFGRGDIHYHGKVYRNLLLNIDALLQSPLVRIGESSVSISLESADVEWFSVDGATFRNLRLLGHEEARDGFYELLFDGGQVCRLYKRVEKKIDTSPESVNGSEIGYTDPNYKGKVHTYFKYMPSYYLELSDGPLQPLRSKNAILKFFPERKKDIKKHLSSVTPSGMILSKEDMFCETVKYICQ